jgi:hypothetical protein
VDASAPGTRLFVQTHGRDKAPQAFVESCQVVQPDSILWMLFSQLQAGRVTDLARDGDCLLVLTLLVKLDDLLVEAVYLFPDAVAHSWRPRRAQAAFLRLNCPNYPYRGSCHSSCRWPSTSMPIQQTLTASLGRKPSQISWVERLLAPPSGASRPISADTASSIKSSHWRAVRIGVTAVHNSAGLTRSTEAAEHSLSWRTEGALTVSLHNRRRDLTRRGPRLILGGAQLLDLLQDRHHIMGRP